MIYLGFTGFNIDFYFFFCCIKSFDQIRFCVLTDGYDLLCILDRFFCFCPVNGSIDPGEVLFYDIKNHVVDGYHGWCAAELTPKGEFIGQSMIYIYLILTDGVMDTIAPLDWIGMAGNDDLPMCKYIFVFFIGFRSKEIIFIVRKNLE